MARKTPILLLKTRSAPGDAYEELFATARDSLEFEPAFVPVLEHAFEPRGLERLRHLLRARGFGAAPGHPYGGLVFTSQRAVEAFSSVVADGPGESGGGGDGEGGNGTGGWPHLDGVPVYSVGPATTRALRAVSCHPPLRIFGEHTGSGDKLARFILDHYADWYASRPGSKPPLLFAVGEQRRDVVPRTLADAQLPPDRRISVDELVVYGTGVMPTFREDLARALTSTADRPVRWVVVFSPTGCDAMLRELGLLDEATGRARLRAAPGVEEESRRRGTYVATIGPTTRDYLFETFGFEPEVCAEQPSPEGVWKGIATSMRDMASG